MVKFDTKNSYEWTNPFFFDMLIMKYTRGDL